ncbi:Immunity protein 26 [Flexibacter flexilis DSM 6793]|uniref:Immunity protein 26 n=1 Tax=Flexibacter flexilis DSM 6793 TaxID=927664 RepID=A0A1I1DII4_9BACT|nr:Imm26 family immunity protein [Flexibacter flexilis]SFB72333.1 Immunity protein 26 [Flexibacter flexilis DSM 6793]
MGKIKRRLKIGDIFAINLPDGSCVTGRIMFYTKKQLPLNNEDSKTNQGTWMMTIGGGVYVDIYKDLKQKPDLLISEPLFRGIFISTALLSDGTWEIISNVPVNPQDVEFPQYVISIPPGVGSWFYVRGEVCLSLPGEKGYNQWHGISCKMIMHTDITRFILKYLNLQETKDSLEKMDLRYHPEKNLVYETLGLNPDESYDSFSKRNGYDIGRFF